MRNNTPAYEVTLLSNEKIRLYSKAELVEFIKYNKDIISVNWYKGCGEWVDVTSRHTINK